jgi:hypothetical protein
MNAQGHAAEPLLEMESSLSNFIIGSSGRLGPRTRDPVSIDTERVRKISVCLDFNDIVARVLQIELALLLRRTGREDLRLRQKRNPQKPEFVPPQNSHSAQGRITPKWRLPWRSKGRTSSGLRCNVIW